MGIRETQVFGLTDSAQKLVKGEQMLAYCEEGERIYPDGARKRF